MIMMDLNKNMPFVLENIIFAIFERKNSHTLQEFLKCQDLCMWEYLVLYQVWICNAYYASEWFIATKPATGKCLVLVYAKFVRRFEEIKQSFW